MNIAKLKNLPIEMCQNLAEEGAISPLELGVIMMHRGLLNWPLKRGEDLKQFRKKHHLTQSDLAKLMNVAKVTLVRWESLEELPAQVSAHFQILHNMERHLVKHMEGSFEYLRDYRGENDFRYDDLPPAVPVSKIENLEFKPLPYFEPEDVKSLRKHFKMTQKAFGEFFSVTPHQIMFWEKGTAKFAPAYLKIFKLLDQLRQIENADIDPMIKKLLIKNIQLVLDTSI